MITIGVYWFETKQWGGTEFGAMFATLGIASVIMPGIVGIVADRWVDAEKLYALLQILYAAALFYLPQINNPDTFFWFMLLAMLFYMPTISLSNSIPYYLLKKSNYDVVKAFPPIRVWGTIGFIAAMWIVNLTGNKASANQFYIASTVAVVLAIYALTLPKCPPLNKIPKKADWVKKLGLEAFVLFKKYKMALFFIFSMLLGAALQLTNMYGDAFLSDFARNPIYQDSFIVHYSTIIMSISQMSEVVFILAIPFFLKRFGIKKVMLMSMAAWVLRFGFFSFGNPGDRLWMIILSMVVYGMAFDFFNISGSLFVEETVRPELRSSAQGVFIMMTNGFGAMLGSYVSGYVIEHFFIMPNGYKNWHQIWLWFAIYALVVGILFALLFKHEHHPEKVKEAL